MARGKKSFFERLTGSVDLDYDDVPEEVVGDHHVPTEAGEREDWLEEESGEGQLTVDVYQTTDDIVIKAIVAGVKPDELEVSITRDMVTIRGRREEIKEATEDSYFYKELYWGAFSRTILLPQEIEVDEATASEKHGMLVIKLPKIDKERQTKLKVRTS